MSDSRKDTETLSEYIRKHPSEIEMGNLKSLQPFAIGLEYTPPARGTWTIAHTPMLIPDSFEIYVCPDSCLRGVVLSALEDRGMDRFAAVSVTEQDVVGEEMEDLFIEGVTDILTDLPALPPCVLVVTSCIHHFAATDLKLIFSELRERFPSVDFVESYMNCTMRKTRLNYEEVQWRQNYRPLRPVRKNPRSVNVIGNYFVLDRESELVRMLEDAGYTLRDICRTKDYEEYLTMAESILNLYTWPVAREACRDLQERLGQKPLYLPYSWDGEEIRTALQELAEATGASLPELDRLEEEAYRELRKSAEAAKGWEVQIDALSTPRPLELARLLIQCGFSVQTVYSDSILPGDEQAAEKLKKEAPSLRLRTMTHYRDRYRPRTDAENVKGSLLAIGQRAAYFSGTEYYVDMVSNEGLWGFTGIKKLAGMIRDSLAKPKDVRKQIQIKAKGCHPCGR